MTLSVALSLIVGLVAQGPAEDTPAGRLAFMKASLEKDPLKTTDAPGAEFKLRPDPVLRFNNPVGDVQDGAIFLWLGASDRPVAAVQTFHHKLNGNWHREFSSLSEVPLSAGPAWGPTSPAGVTFKPIPGGPKPADTPEKRLRQMHALTREFTAEQAGQAEAARSNFHRLRLLPKPFARYGKAGTDVLDGALFAFVDTTDPEVYLLIESRPGTGGEAWHYAFAPASIAPLKGVVKGVEVWSLPYRQAWTRRTAPFYVGWFGQSPVR